jgi:hypothetical protein
MGNFIQGKYNGRPLGAAHGTAHHSSLEMRPGRSIVCQILVRCPLSGGNSVCVLKIDMENMGAAPCEVLHLAGIARTEVEQPSA